MYVHIVMFRLKESQIPAEQSSVACELKEKLLNLKEYIPELKKINVGLNVNPSPRKADLVLETEFDSLEGYEAYRIHPRHQEVVTYISEMCTETWVVDY